MATPRNPKKVKPAQMSTLAAQKASTQYAQKPASGPAHLSSDRAYLQRSKAERLAFARQRHIAKLSRMAMNPRRKKY